MTAIVAQITYKGTLVSDQITTAPWNCVYISWPERGGIPYMPQFELDVLQPRNVDGARYRVAGSHFPVFKMLTITPADTYLSAQTIAREMELCKGEFIDVALIALGSGIYESVCVINCKAFANVKRVLGATAYGGGSGPASTAAQASVDTEWTLQVIPV